MATNIPPHHPADRGCDGRPDRRPGVHVGRPLQARTGPDFPTGGTIFRYEKQRNTHRGAGDGRRHPADVRPWPAGHARPGRVRGGPRGPYVDHRQRAAVPGEQGRPREDGGTGRATTTWISDLRDESDRDGMRIYIEIKGLQPAQGAQQPVQAHADAARVQHEHARARRRPAPDALLRSVLVHYLDHRREIVRRRTEFDLARPRRAHILEGLKIALDHLDAVIKTIRESADVDVARGQPHESVRPVRAAGAGHPRHAATASRRSSARRSRTSTSRSSSSSPSSRTSSRTRPGSWASSATS